MYKYSTRVKAELIRKEWYSMGHHGIATNTEYYIRYRGLGYHGALRVIHTDAGKWRVLLTDGTIIDTEDLKTMYRAMRGIVRQEVMYIDRLMEV